MNPDIKTFINGEELADWLAEHFIQYVHLLFKKKDTISIALSGGTTPNLFYRRLAVLCSAGSGTEYLKKIHFFWGDERCVPPNHEESNYGVFYRLFVRPLNLKSENIHRITGESDPVQEAISYSEKIRKIVSLKNNYPAFDWIFLGLGDDGHTASIFPNQLSLLHSKNDCEMAIHPVTGQKRVTLTGKVLINANRITFMVTGENKKEIVKEILKNEFKAKNYPAYFIKPLHGKMEWLLEKKAASLL